MKRIFSSLLCGLMATSAFAQWSPTSMRGERIRTTSSVNRHYSLDLNKMRSALYNAQETGRSAVPVEIKIPTLNGKIERFAVYSAPVVVKSISDRYQLGSYIGQGIDDPTAFVRFSIAPNDFQSMVVRNGVYEFVEPQNKEKSVYGVHPKTNKTESDNAFVCSTSETPLSKKQMDKLYMSGKSFGNNPSDFSRASDRKFRTMRLAMSVTGEYTAYFGGLAGALAAINATLTRTNGVFETDFGLRLILQDFPQLIYTDAATDPYSNASVGTNNANANKLEGWSLQLQNTLSTTIGSAAYDIGHLFGASGGGGNAGCIGCVCIAPTSETLTNLSKGKGSAYTSPSDGIPEGDKFDIDYVAHEIGHQLGANHTFSHVLENTGQNVEPGSGSTIMGYAGITNQNVQQYSDAYFHINSIVQVQNNLVAKTCDIETAVGNNPPSIASMADLTIPKSTPFVLTAQATDAEGDPLTYTWEEVDPASTATTITNLGTLTNGPTFRSLSPTANPTRYFPKLATVLAGSLKNNEDWEAVSTVARIQNFTVTVRDNNPDVTQRQTQSAKQNMTISDKGPFRITSTKVYNNAPAPFTWDVVGTNVAPFNVTNVIIDYTSDNGATWNVLRASTANDGTEDISFADFATDTALKVRVSAIGNVFYTIAPVIVSAIIRCDGTAPAGLTVYAITLTGASVIWDPVADATYIVRYKKAADATWTEVASATNSLSLTGLEEATDYNIQVATVCSGSRGSYTPVTNFSTLKMTYCTLTSNNSTDEYISGVQIAAEGALSMNSTSGASNYTNYYADPGRLVNLARGTANNKITVAKAWTSDSYNDAVTAWIDFDRSGTFDSDEIILSSAPSKLTPVVSTFSVPADAYVGDKTVGMRVALRYSALQTNVCGTYNYGEVEDYAVKISATLNVNSHVKSNSVQVYPNPAVDVLNITKVSDRAAYTIYNMAGQAVSKGKVSNNKVQVSQLEKGVYMISVDNDGQVSQVKFIKK